MKVYVVTMSEQSLTTVLKIFSTCELAEKYVSSFSVFYSSKLTISELEVDQ